MVSACKPADHPDARALRLASECVKPARLWGFRKPKSPPNWGLTRPATEPGSAIRSPCARSRSNNWQRCSTFPSSSFTASHRQNLAAVPSGKSGAYLKRCRSCPARSRRRLSKSSRRWLPSTPTATAADFLFSRVSGVAFRGAQRRGCAARAPQITFHYQDSRARAARCRGALATRTVSARARIAPGPHELPPGNAPFDRPRLSIAPPPADKEIAPAFRARRGSQSAYIAGRRAIAVARQSFPARARRCQSSILKAVFSDHPKPSHAERDIQIARDGRRDFQPRHRRRRRVLPRSGKHSIRAPIFSKFAEWGRTGARRRGLCSRARKIRTHCVIIKWRHGVSRGPPCRAARCLSQRPILCHTMCSYLSEQICLYFRAVGRFPHRP